MKNAIKPTDNECASIESIHNDAQRMVDQYDRKIARLLAKYDESWIGNEHNVAPSKIDNHDYNIYNELFDARANMQHILGQLTRLLDDNPPPQA